jgi:hypothetical protein
MTFYSASASHTITPFTAHLLLQILLQNAPSSRVPTASHIYTAVHGNWDEDRQSDKTDTIKIYRSARLRATLPTMGIGI